MPGRRRSTLLACAMFMTVLAAPQVVSADGVDQAQNKVDTVLDQLDDLQNRMGQLDEDYGMAEHRRAQLAVEIDEAQVKIDALGSELGKVEQVLTQIAVDRFTSGDRIELSPVFTDVSSYSTGQQMDALALAAIDIGQTDLDNMQQVADRLAAEQRAMQRKTDEAAALMDTLDSARADYTKLEAEYTKKYAQAKRDLGEAKLQAEQERRAAAEVVQRAKVAKAAAKKTAAAPRGGAQSSNSSTSKATATGGSSAPSQAVAPSSNSSASGKAAIAINAALGQLGVPYKFATSSPGESFDCSGLTAWAWAQAGVGMPHVSRLQFSSLPHVDISNAQPGDLIFYYSPISHVGLYIGNGQMVHAPNTGSVVNVTTVRWNKVVGVARPG
ncbi:MAG: NlpC/P60 family protein [Actinomycetota bacterium]|nr:NlpC/P60 family protein [Actinomycetota bacterium]